MIIAFRLTFAGFGLAIFAFSTATVQAQFNREANNGTITIIGPGGAVTIPDTTNGLPVTVIGQVASAECLTLTSVSIGNGVTNSAFGVRSIGYWGFAACRSLTGAYFQGNAPAVDPYAFDRATSTSFYYLPGTTGWGPTFGVRPTAPWVLPYPVTLTTASDFGIQTNAFDFSISWATNASAMVEASAAACQPRLVPDKHQCTRDRVIGFQRCRLDELCGSVLPISAMVMQKNGMGET